MVSFKTLTALCLTSTVFAAMSVEAAPITVTSTADAGGTCPGAGCTLRQAIATVATEGTINFSLPAGSTILLTSDQLAIDKSLTINGPGAKLLTVARNASAGDFRIFKVAAGATVALSGLTIANGRTPGDVGSGVYNLGSLTLARSTLSGNTAPGIGDGGGIFNAGILALVDSTISGNSAYLGGGVVNTNNGAMTISGSTIGPANSATGDLGGAGIYNEGELMMTNSTVSGNSTSGNGGGISHVGSATITITNSTIAGNSAGHGGGVYVPFSVAYSMNLRNTIIAQNTFAAQGSGPDIDGWVVSDGYNLIGSNVGYVIDVTNDNATSQLGVNPLLDTLKDNGGPTRTHALLSGSPAIDRGHSSGSNTDQRGYARPVLSPLTGTSIGDGADIGAYEVQADVLPGCPTINRIVMNNNDSGADSLRDVIAKVCAGSVITFAPNVTGAINLTSGELHLNKSLTIGGPGAKVLNVQRDAAAGNFRVFNVASGVLATISGLTIANGSVSTESGGGILNSGTLTVSSAVISGNSTAFHGAGIRSTGVLNLVDSIVSGNSSVPPFGAAAGISSTGTATITNSTISGNTTSAGPGGGIRNDGTVTIINSTISGNTAAGGIEGGGGIDNVGALSLINSTIAGNTAATSYGGGIFASVAFNATNTIIALNTATAGGPDVYGHLNSQGFNLIGDASGMVVSPLQFTDQIGVSAAQLNLGPLQDNGGPTPTRALLAGSVAIDKGNASGYATDQRGFARVVDLPAIANATDGDGSDIGAFEYGSGHLDIDGNRKYDALTDGVLLVRYLLGLTGTALTGSAIGPQPTRPTAAEILPFLTRMNPALDVDANGSVEVATDGLMVLRYLLGYRGAALTADAIGGGATRTAAQIEAYIQSLMP